MFKISKLRSKNELVLLFWPLFFIIQLLIEDWALFYRVKHFTFIPFLFTISGMLLVTPPLELNFKWVRSSKLALLVFLLLSAYIRTFRLYFLVGKPGWLYEDLKRPVDHKIFFIFSHDVGSKSIMAKLLEMITDRLKSFKKYFFLNVTYHLNILGVYLIFRSGQGWEDLRAVIKIHSCSPLSRVKDCQESKYFIQKQLPFVLISGF